MGIRMAWPWCVGSDREWLGCNRLGHAAIEDVALFRSEVKIAFIIARKEIM